MKDLISTVQIKVNERIYLKDPVSSALGQKIITGSIDLIADIGFEAFTFRKLASSIGSTEASIYRYFESKHKLLLYLTSWHWGWMEYRLVFSLANIEDPVVRLEKAIVLLTNKVEEDHNFAFINEPKLWEIVIAESSKVYLTKDVDQENQDGVFTGYKRLVARIGDIILEINPKYKYPHMLVSSMIEGAHHERYFARHLPKLTNDLKGENSITEFYKDLVFKTIGNAA
ncbi:MAG: TetR/AcrR family transcriptional regulator [Saprospiraceae bacterium]|nr:TetR/AcrR family transcriptional regulator [Saprospiraceae bacterium]